jgi:hypothetical protein
MKKLFYLCLLTCLLGSCLKESKLSPSSNPPVLNPTSRIDTFSLPINHDCNFGLSADTCYFERNGDTLKISGILQIVCGYSTVIMTEKNDSILINWCPNKGPICNVCLLGCFDLKIPNATNYSVVKFLGKTYKGF